VAIGPLTDEQADVLLRVLNRHKREWWSARHKEVPRAKECRELSPAVAADIAERILDEEKLLLEFVK
jgi:hypothetical protein